MSNFKRKKVAAAAFTFLMAFSSISGATIANAEIPALDDQGVEDSIITNNHNSFENFSRTLNLTYLKYQNLVDKYNPELDEQTRRIIYDSALSASIRYEVPVELILAVIGCESEFHPKLFGLLDDTGLMQIRLRYADSWARGMGVSAPSTREDLTDIELNIHMGTYILNYLLKQFDYDIHKSLVAYNAGEGYVNRKLSNNESLPTNYITRVSVFYQEITNAALW